LQGKSNCVLLLVVVPVDSCANWKSSSLLVGNCSAVLKSGDEGRLLLVVKLLYFCSDVWIRVGGVKSQPFTAGIGLRHGFLF